MSFYQESLWDKLTSIHFPTTPPQPSHTVDLTFNLTGGTAQNNTPMQWFVSAQNINKPHDVINGPSTPLQGNPPNFKNFAITVQALGLPGGYALRLVCAMGSLNLFEPEFFEASANVFAFCGSPGSTPSHFDSTILGPGGKIGTASATLHTNPTKTNPKPPAPITINKVKAPGGAYSGGDFSNFLLSANGGRNISQTKAVTFDLALDFTGTKVIGITAGVYRTSPWDPNAL